MSCDEPVLWVVKGQSLIDCVFEYKVSENNDTLTVLSNYINEDEVFNVLKYVRFFGYIPCEEIFEE